MTLADVLMAGFEREYAPPRALMPTDINSPEWAEFNRETWRYMHRRDQEERENG